MKPRIRAIYIDGKFSYWACRDGCWVGYGETMLEAYSNSTALVKIASEDWYKYKRKDK